MTTSDVRLGGNMPANLPPGWVVADRILQEEEDPFDDTAGTPEDPYAVWASGERSLDPFESDEDAKEAREKMPEFTNVTLSQFTELAFRMPRSDGELGFENFSFEGRRHMLRIYNTPAKRILLVCARQVEKCVVTSSRISLADGSTKPAGKIAVGDRVAALDVLSGGSWMTTGSVTWVSATYRKPCVRIETRQGHVVEVAVTHPMRVWGGWRDGGDIAVGDRLAVVRRCGEFTSTASVPEARIRLTAYLLGDGSLSTRSISFTSLPGEKLEEFKKDLCSLGMGFSISSKKRTRALLIRPHRTGPLEQWLREDGLLGCRSSSKFLPAWVFRLSRQATALFLNRLWSTDGHCKRNARSKYSLEYCSVSLRLVQGVQALLWKFGIPSKIRRIWPSLHKKKGRKKYAYILRVETQQGVRTFLEEIGALGKSAAAVQAPLLRSNNNRDTYPVEINELISRIVRSRVAQRRGPKADNSLRSVRLRERLQYPPTRGKIEQYVNYFRQDARFDQRLVDELAQHLTTDLYWDEVTKVTQIGEKECIDFEVQGAHNFVANGFVTHNSTMLGNRALAYSCLVPGFRTLYVSPTSTQTKTFSSDRINDPIQTSEVLRAFTTKMLSANVFEKRFVNYSVITLRNAFLNADRTRGIPAWLLELDEFQDLLSDNIPVIEQCTSHAPERWKQFCYAGTPKSLDNNIEFYRAGYVNGQAMSTQGEWVVPCDSCGSKAGAGRFWNILGERNIGKKGLICEKCGELINPQHPEAQWANMVSDGIFESYRIPQLMVPWKKWEEILIDYQKYPRDKFYNEVLGLSFDSGTRPLTMAQVRECCDPEYTMHPDFLARFKPGATDNPVFAGIDWGCHDEETRILTERGFVYFRDLTENDRVAQWDPVTREVTFVLPRVRTIRDWDQPLLHFQTKGGVDLMVTHTHRMRVKGANGDNWVTESAGETAARPGHVNFVGYVDWVGEERASFTLPGLPKSPGYAGSDDLVFQMDDWLELLGYLISEGGVCYDGERPSCIKMSQRETVNPDKCDKMRACLTRLSVPFTEFPNKTTGDVNWTIYGKQFWHWYLENIGGAPEEKRIPREFLKLSKRQLWILFHALVDGDGYVDSREGGTGGAFYSTSRGLCEDFQEICIRLGLRCIVRPHKPAEGNRQARWRALWSRGRDYYFNTPSARVRRVPYKGKVYCCSVPTGYIVTERNGCISYQGNTGEKSYTVLTLGTYVGGVFRIIYAHRFTGQELDPPVQIAMIKKILHEFNVHIIGADYGGGFYPNDALMREFGPRKLVTFQYLGRMKRKVGYEPKLRRYQVFRTPVMSDIFNAIKRKQIRFPRWEEFQEPYASDMCNIFSEYNKTTDMLQYNHRPDRPDDTFHSVLYCFLASMIKFPRPDIIAPHKEDPTNGVAVSDYSGPLWQG